MKISQNMLLGDKRWQTVDNALYDAWCCHWHTQFTHIIIFLTRGGKTNKNCDIDKWMAESWLRYWIRRWFIHNVKEKNAMHNKKVTLILHDKSHEISVGPETRAEENHPQNVIRKSNCLLLNVLQRLRDRLSRHFD